MPTIEARPIVHPRAAQSHRALDRVLSSARIPRALPLVLLLALALALPARATVLLRCDQQVVQNHRFECLIEHYGLTADWAGLVAYRDIQIRADFSGPSGETRTSYAFWDYESENGRLVYLRLRQFFPVPGTWSLVLSCEVGPCDTYHGLQRSVEVLPYVGSNPVYTRGMPFPAAYTWFDEHQQIERSWKALEWGTPGAGEAFPWVGDSAWAAPLRAVEPAWSSVYLADRAARGFTVIHLGPAPSWAWPEGTAADLVFGPVAGCSYDPEEDLDEARPSRCDRIQPGSWQKLD